MPHTDHSVQIEGLRRAAHTTNDEDRKAMFNAAAALLEVHDLTGISLDEWDGPKQLVNLALKHIGERPFHRNYV